MLNRRILRIKALQSVYAYDRCRQAAYNLSFDRIDEQFEPDLNSMEVQDTEKLKEQSSRCRKIFRENFDKEQIEGVEADEGDLLKIVIVEISQYKRRCENDFRQLRGRMLDDAERIQETYLAILLLLVELSDYSGEDRRQRRNHSYLRDADFDYRYKLLDNTLIAKLRQHTDFKERIDNGGIRWPMDQIAGWYRILEKDETFQKYRDAPVADEEADFAMADYLFRTFILKNETVSSFFEGEDLYWVEDKSVIKSMVTKTLRNLREGEDLQEVELIGLSGNWEDDREFFSNLFTSTIESYDEYETLVADKVKNWSIERVTLTDKIVLKMAVTEMVQFPTIPIKVTINEYLEISKSYSTPRSRQFINGVLDVLSKELTEKGLISKSGRGLIDAG